MEKIRKAGAFIFTSLVLLSTRMLTFAQGGENPGGGGQNPGVKTLENPIGSQTVLEFILKIIDVLLIFAVPIIILFIMYAGFLFVTARGNEEQIKKARRALLWAVVGGVIALGAKLIISVLENTIEAF